MFYPQPYKEYSGQQHEGDKYDGGDQGNDQLGQTKPEITRQEFRQQGIWILTG